MTFLWPEALALLLLVPLGVVLSRRLGRRRLAGATARLGPGIRPTAGPSGRPARLRLRVPALLVLAGLVVLTIGLARPQGTVAVPREEGTVILAFDVSGSMAATDVKPSRLAAAQQAAKTFVDHQPPGVVVGVVAFSDSGISTQAPTSDQGAVLDAIDRLAPQKGTSVGQGILASLKAISLAETGPNVDFYTNRTPAPTPTPSPVPAGSHDSAVIVLISDGENNEAPDPTQAAREAAQRGVRVFTVGMGTEEGTTLDLNGFKVHTQLQAGTLQGIAEETDGTYFVASSADDLASVYDRLDTALVVKPEAIELTAVFAGAGLVLLLAGALASLFWLGRLP